LSQTRTMATAAALNAERFLADRAAPICGLNVATSFAQLRCDQFIIHKTTDNVDVLDTSVQRRKSMRTTWVSLPGPERVSFKVRKLKIFHQGSPFHTNLVSCVDQWTPEARDLYDLLVATFSSSEGAVADFGALQTSSGLSSGEWDDLLQYTCQVRQPFSSSDLPILIYLVQVLNNLVNYKSFGFTKIIPRVSADKFEAVIAKSANAPKALGLWEKVRLDGTPCMSFSGSDLPRS